MKALRTIFPRYLCVLLVLSVVFISVPFTTSAEQASKQVGGEGFELSADQDTISLKATNAPLRAILVQIGQDLNIKVDAQVADDETVTDEFQALPLDQVLRRLVPNRAIISDESNGKITKIVIMREGEAGQAAPTVKKGTTTASGNEPSLDGNKSTEPFKFEFDPSAVIQKSREEEARNRQ